MIKTWTRFVELLDRRQDATALAVCRIVAAVTVFLHLTTMWISGTASGVWVSVQFGGIRESDLDWLERFGGATPLNVKLLLTLGIAASALMAVGLFTRVACVLTWLAFRVLTGLNDHAGGSSDDLLINVLFLLMFSGCGGALSLDNRKGPPKEVPVWPRYVLLGQLVLIYWMTGLQKVSAAWLPGGSADALWYIFQQPSWQRISMFWLARAYPLTQAGTLMAWTFEQSAPLLLLAFWYRYTRERPGRVRAFFNRIDFRTLYLSVGMMIHLGIWMTLEVGPFAGGVFSLYACCFTPDEYRALVTRLRATSALRRLRRSPSIPS
jgi:hypothetical protein